MEEWRKSRREGLGRTTYLTTAMRLASNRAKLSGVDVTGKTARLKAEQQGKEEAELRRARGTEKPLWAAGPNPSETSQTAAAPPAPTPVPTKTCDQRPNPTLPQSVPFVNKKNPYGSQGSAVVSDITHSMSERLPEPQQPPREAPSDKPIPKFLDKKSRKRLRALRRQEARNKSLASAG